MVDYSVGHNDAFAAFIETKEIKDKYERREEDERHKNYQGDMSNYDLYTEIALEGLTILLDSVRRGFIYKTDGLDEEWLNNAESQLKHLLECDEYDVIKESEEFNSIYYFRENTILTEWALDRLYYIILNKNNLERVSLTSPIDKLLIRAKLLSRKKFIPWHKNNFFPEVTVDNMKRIGILNILANLMKTELNNINKLNNTVIEYCNKE